MTSDIPVLYSEIRKNKKMLFGLLGLVSGMLGALLAEIVRFLFPTSSGPLIIITVLVALWTGVVSAVIATGFYWTIDFYGHKKIDWPELLKKGIPVGFIAGAISGGVAQLIFGPVASLLSNDLIKALFQIVCWGIFGLILGWRFSKSIPNLDSKRATIAGAAGGFLGGAGFIIVSYLLIETPGRMLGMGILGAALGLCLVIVEEISRVAFIEVHWNTDEISMFSLGSTPVFIGSGDSDIFVPTVPNRAMSIVIEGGQIIATDHTKGKRKELTEGDPISIGKITMIVRTPLGKMKAGSDP